MMRYINESITHYTCMYVNTYVHMYFLMYVCARGLDLKCQTKPIHELRFIKIIKSLSWTALQYLSKSDQNLTEFHGFWLLDHNTPIIWFIFSLKLYHHSTIDQNLFNYKFLSVQIIKLKIDGMYTWNKLFLLKYTCWCDNIYK